MKKSHGGAGPPSGALMTMSLAVLDGRAERAEGVEVRVQPAAADHVAARRRHRGAAEAREQRAGGQERGADPLGERRVDVRLVHVGRVQHRRCWGSGRSTRHAEVREQLAAAPRCRGSRGTLCSVDVLVREQGTREQRQRGVLVSGGHDGAGQRHAAFDDELLHRGGG